MTRERIAAAILRWARVSEKPEPPVGAPDSIRVFRAGRNHYYMKLLGWGLTQVGAAIGLLFSIGFVTSLEVGTNAILVLPPPRPAPSASAAPAATPSASPAPPTSRARIVDPADWPTPIPANASAETRRSRNRDARAAINRILQRLSTTRYFPLFVNYGLPLLIFFEYLGIATFFVLFVATYFMARLEYEQHWYIVTDRSLRIRTGVLSLSESTMSFANLQQVEVKQGPIQNALGLADVRVQSAGGGSSHEEAGHDSLHTGVFHNVENAEEIRDLILTRLRAFRETGLGDPGESRQRAGEARSAPRGVAAAALAPALEAARELLEEARALRAALDQGTSTSSPEQART